MQKILPFAENQSAGPVESWLELLPGLLLIGATVLAVFMLSLQLSLPTDLLDYSDFMHG
jgi:hypothetical protein